MALTLRARTPSPTRTPLGSYRDFVIVARRLNTRKVGVSVEASPAGRLDEFVQVMFPEKEATALRDGFVTSFARKQVKGGRMMITAMEASAIGKRLAEVLFPREILRLFAASLASVVGAGNCGLRIRLSMDASLLDLPWEYVSRPDRGRAEAGAVSDFLLLDPTISMIRHAADASVKLEPITGQQRLAFVGTFWEGSKDAWEVGKEFALLNKALSPVTRYIRTDFTPGNNIKEASMDETAIFHYAGHCDFEKSGRAFLVKEMPVSRSLAPKEDGIYIDELAPRLAASGTRLAVMSACNSGYWAAAKPLLNAGVPAVIGINGGVASISTIEFCAKVYESLAVGLSLDEAVSRARMHLFEWGAQYDLFDWGLFMVHMTCSETVLFPRRQSAAIERQQRTVQQAHAETIGSTLELVRKMDGLNFGELMSECTQRRVLIL